MTPSDPNNTQPPPPDTTPPPIEDLLRDIEATRLPPEVREAILKEMPPPEELERLYREIQEKGGYSFEQLFDSTTPSGITQP